MGLRPTFSEFRSYVLFVLTMSNLKTEGKKQINDQVGVFWDRSKMEGDKRLQRTDWVEIFRFFFFFLCHLQCFVYNGDVFANWALVYLKKKNSSLRAYYVPNTRQV